MDKVTKLKNDIKKLDELKEQLFESIIEERSNKKFKCLCGKLHQIKQCALVEEKIWFSGYGYEDGHYGRSRFYIVCKDSSVSEPLLNRLYFSLKYDDMKNRYDYTIEDDFLHNYAKSFKTQCDYTQLCNVRWGNSTYIEDNINKFT